MDASLPLVENAVRSWRCGVADGVGNGGAGAATDGGSPLPSRLLAADSARRPGTRRRRLDPWTKVSRCIAMPAAEFSLAAQQREASERGRSGGCGERWVSGSTASDLAGSLALTVCPQASIVIR